MGYVGIMIFYILKGDSRPQCSEVWILEASQNRWPIGKLGLALILKALHDPYRARIPGKYKCQADFLMSTAGVHEDNEGFWAPFRNYVGSILEKYAFQF